MSRSAKSTSNCDIDFSKIWFNQHYDNPNQPESGFDVTFTASNSNPRPASSIPLQENTNSSTDLLEYEGENRNSPTSPTLEKT